MSKERQVLQLFLNGDSQRRIASTLQVSRNRVAAILAGVKRSQDAIPHLLQLDDAALLQKLFPEKSLEPIQVPPDFSRIHKELLRHGVTLHLLWEEYVDDCRSASKPPYMYSQFCKLYSDYVDKNRLTMHIQHKPGDKLMVDWAGTKLSIYDKNSEKTLPCYLFVATLPFSMYCYAEAFLSMKQEDWINAHIHLYRFLGGSTRLLVSDNLKTGVVQNSKHEDPIFNRSYAELAEHYQTALLPARVLAPKDKAAVEGTVGVLTSKIIAKLRDKSYFSLYELNQAVFKELKAFNERPFQKKDGNRYSVYTEEELPFMKPLPPFPYEFASWKIATVQLNYHIAFDKQYYSVPYSFVKKKVDVRSTDKVVEVYYKGQRICSHSRLHGRMGQYVTNPDHMPPNHQLYSEWNSDRFKRWAGSIGPSTKEVIDRIFNFYRVEEQAYKGCLSLLKLVDKYSAIRLENACKVALAHIPMPRYKNIRLILEAGQDLPSKAQKDKKEQPGSINKFTKLRGVAYYGGSKHEC